MKLALLPSLLTLALGAGLAVAQAPVVRQTPDQTPAATAPQQDATAPAMKHAHHAKNPNKEAARLAKELGLTPDQQAKVAAALADRDQKVDALEANTSIDPQAAKKQMHGIHKDSEAQIASILTPDQLQKMQEMRKEHGAHGKGAQGAPMTTPPSTPPTT